MHLRRQKSPRPQLLRTASQTSLNPISHLTLHIISGTFKKMLIPQTATQPGRLALLAPRPIIPAGSRPE